MLSLALAIVCSASIALIFRYSEGSGANRYAVTSANYVAAVAAGGVLLLARGGVRLGDEPLGARLDEIGRALQGGDRLSAAASPVWAAIVGLVAGAFFLGGFLVYQKAVRDHGVGLSGSFAKLGILLPTGLGLVLWREDPRVTQWAGMALAVLALVVVHAPRGGRGAVQPALVLLFLLGGLAEFSNRVYQRHGLQADRDVFLLATFGSALLLSLVATVLARRPVKGSDVMLGLAVGIPNLFASFFLIGALEVIPSAVAFSVYGAGTVLILGVAGVAVFRERPSRAEILAMGATVAAVVLVQL